jgi:hypothetical protein
MYGLAVPLVASVVGGVCWAPWVSVATQGGCFATVTLTYPGSVSGHLCCTSDAGLLLLPRLGLLLLTTQYARPGKQHTCCVKREPFYCKSGEHADKEASAWCWFCKGEWDPS